jgi:hypothetical protein
MLNLLCNSRLMEEMVKLQVETQDLSEKFDGVKHEVKISLSQRREAEHVLHDRDSQVCINCSTQTVYND